MLSIWQNFASNAIALTRIALGILVVAVIAGQIAIVFVSAMMAEEYPEFASLQLPLVAAAIACGVCAEVVLIATVVLVGFTRDDRIFRPQALRLVDTLIVALVAATIIDALVLVAIPGPPALALVIIAGAFVGATFTLVLFVLRSLLRHAVLMRVELDEVV